MCHDGPTVFDRQTSSWKGEQMVVYDLAEDGSIRDQQPSSRISNTVEMGAQLNPRRKDGSLN